MIRRLQLGFIGIVALLIGTDTTWALSPKDLQVIGRAITFLEAPPKGAAEIGVLLNPSDPKSVAEAAEVQALIGGGLTIDQLKLTARLVPIADLNRTSGLSALIVLTASPEMLALVEAAGTGQKLLTISTDLACVQQGACVMGARSEPKIEIVLNKPLAQAAGITFSTAFRMMIKEIQPQRP